MKKFIKKTDAKKGFSLVELICVIAIIVILGSVIAFNYIKIVKNLPWEELVGENPFSVSTSANRK
ncbi:MAG: type II secretion system GspH family protein [Saccharofermentans sp.]|nr:type II secretion system GspH family protein [Saccharofermentans sp.]